MRPALRGSACTVALAIAYGLCREAACAQPAPAPTATPDPCAGLLSLLDRPTVGFSPCAVALHTSVAEIGVQRQVTGPASNRQTQWQYGQTFLRFGVRRHFEADVIGPSELTQRTSPLGQPDTVASGVADYGVGFKYQLPGSRKTSLAFDGLYTGPNGAPAFTAGNGVITGNADVSYTINDTTSVGATLALSATGGYAVDGSHARYGTFQPSFVVTKQLGNTLQLYAEYVYVSKLAPDSGGRAFVDYGVQKLLGGHIELDAELAHSIVPGSAHAFSYAGVGLGILLP